MKNYGALLTILGLGVLALSIIIKRYREVSDFIYGVSHGISIAFLVMGLIFTRLGSSKVRDSKWKLLKSMFND